MNKMIAVFDEKYLMVQKFIIIFSYGTLDVPRSDNWCPICYRVAPIKFSALLELLGIG